MYVVCKIHNNSLGKVVSAKDEQDAIDILKGWVTDDCFDITDEDIDSIHDNMEYCNDDDSDNVFTYSVGIVE